MCPSTEMALKREINYTEAITEKCDCCKHSEWRPSGINEGKRYLACTLFVSVLGQLGAFVVCPSNTCSKFQPAEK